MESLGIKLFCVRFLTFKDKDSTNRTVLSSNKRLVGVEIPPLAYACIISDSKEKPSLSGNRHFIEGREISLDEVAQLLKDRTVPLVYGAHSVKVRMEKEQWKRAVLTRLVSKPYPMQMIYGLFEGDSIIHPPRTFFGGKVMTPKEALKEIKKSSIPMAKKRQIITPIEEGRWEKVVRVNPSLYKEFREGDQVISLR